MTTQSNTPLPTKRPSLTTENTWDAMMMLIIGAFGFLSFAGIILYMVWSNQPPEGFVTGQQIIIDDIDNENESHDNYAHRMYQPGDVGQITYCEPDAYSRPTCAHGLLTQANVDQNHQRTEITIDPTGWPTQNDAWLKTHLISPVLGGDTQKNNLIPATRLLREQFDKIEQETKDYLSNPGNAQCPLYYAVTPNYEGDELIPRTITIDIESCDHVLSKRHTLYNTMAYYSNKSAINYHTGEIWEH